MAELFLGDHEVNGEAPIYSRVRLINGRLNNPSRFRIAGLWICLVLSWIVPPAQAEIIPHDVNVSRASVWKAEFEAYLQGVMADHHLPGIAVELVDQQGTLWQITLGYRNTVQRLPVTPQTLYGIGSTSKAFTGMLMMQLQEDGRLKIDSPVQKYLPTFALSESQYSSQITLRDLMTHATGVARHDFAWYGQPALSREELFAKIPFLEMGAVPRTQFIYNNWMWMAAAMIAEQQGGGPPWEQLIQSRILTPLRMNKTVVKIADVKTSSDYSLPYEIGSLGVREVPFYDLGGMAPAGGIFSNLNDMARWLRLHLNQGELEGTSIVSPAGLAEIHRGTMSMGGGAKYGLGWASVDFGGKLLLTHDGGIDGFSSNVSMIPSLGLGVVVLMNASVVAPQNIALRIWQHVLNMPLKDFVRDSAKAQEEQFERTMKQFPDAPQVALTTPLQDYLGSFCHTAYPAVEVKLGPRVNELMLNLSILRMTAYPVAVDQFSLRGQYNDGKVVKFERDMKGQVHSLEWKVEQTARKALRFKRCSSSHPSYM